MDSTYPLSPDSIRAAFPGAERLIRFPNPMAASPRVLPLDPALWPLAPHLLQTLPSPSLLVWTEHVRRNVAAILALAGPRWRPHVKTVKVPELLAIPVELGVRAFKCATTLEARVMASVLEELVPGRGDLLVAFPHVGPNLRRLAELAAALPGVCWSILSEDPAHARAVPEPFGVFVDVNTGMNRTGAPIADVERIVATARAAGSRFRGIHAYDGHHTELDAVDRAERVRAGNTRLRGLLDELERRGLPAEEVVTAGTPALPAALADPGWEGRRERHQVSPGTVVLGDLRTLEQVPELGLVPAALVLARVVSRPAAGRVTCDAGSKALSADVDVVGRPVGHPELEPCRPSEEHLPLVVREGKEPELGTPLLFVPGHVCPTVNLYDEVVLIEGGSALRRARVAARGHE